MAPSSAGPSAPGPAQAPPPRAVATAPATRRPWWHAIGVMLIVAGGLFLIDLAVTGRLTWSPLVFGAVAFIVGGISLLQALAAPGSRDPKVLAVGAGLVVLGVVLVPLAIAVQSTPTSTETFIEPMRAGVDTVSIVAASDVGRLTFRVVAGLGVLAKVDVTHRGGIAATHYAGDVTLTNATSGGTLSLTIRASAGRLPFLSFGGHDITVLVNRDVRATAHLTSTTGNVDVDLPAGSSLGSGGVSATVTTGSVSIRAVDVAFAPGAVVLGQSTTGSVAIDIAQTTGHPGTWSVQGTTTTGSISFTFDAGTGVAARVVSTVTTGSVSANPAKYSGPSEALQFAPSSNAYDSAAMKFDVSLQTTTGSITLG